MKINLEIINIASIESSDKIENLNEKAIVSDGMLRRRLTRNSRIALYLANELNAIAMPMIIGNCYGEVSETYDILYSIKNKQTVSPTAFQNSVHNTPASYISIVGENKGYIATISDSDSTTDSAIKLAAVKLFDYEEMLVIITDAINFEILDDLNRCGIDKKEAGVGFILRRTEKRSDFNIYTNKASSFSPSLNDAIALVNAYNDGFRIFEVDI